MRGFFGVLFFGLVAIVSGLIGYQVGLSSTVGAAERVVYVGGGRLVRGLRLPVPPVLPVRHLLVRRPTPVGRVGSAIGPATVAVPGAAAPPA